MKLNTLIVIPAIALTAGLSLAACGSLKTPAAVPAVTHTVTAPAATPKPSATTAPPNATPAPAKTVIVQPAPAKTVYAAPAAPAYTGQLCGSGVYAGANTSCPFALNVAANYTGSGADYAYSPVTGLNYTMYCYGFDPVTCTGGDNASVQFHG